MDSGTALANLQSYQKSMMTPDAAAEQANQQLGVGGAQQQVQGLRGAIARTSGLLQQVAPSVYGRTQGSLVTNAQAGRQIQNEQAPIATQLDTENRNYGNASEDYKDLLNRAQTKAAGTLQGQQGQLSYLQQLYHDITAKEQTDRDEAYRQSQLAEQRRQADLSAATTRATSGGSSGASPSFSTASGGGTSGYAMTRDKSGGFQFSAAGKPVTAGQYIVGNGGGWSDLLKLLSSSGNKGDQQIAREMASGASQQQLSQKYPYVFGGI